MVAREAAAMLEEESPFVRNVNKSRQDEFGQDISGYKKGASVRIKIPPTGVVYDGATFAGGGSAPDFVETYETLSLDTQKHVPLTFTAKEKLTDITDFKERILRPQINTLAAAIEAWALQNACQATPNKVGTIGTIPTSMKTFAYARQKLERNLAPNGDRMMFYTDDVGPELIDASKALFSPPAEISSQYKNGSIGRAVGSDWYEMINLPTQAVGTRAGTVTVSGASQTGSSINVGCTNGDTFKKGEIITLPGSFEVHPLTGTAFTTLRQFVLTADVTASGTTASLSIFPAIDTAMPSQTVSASPTNGGTVAFGYSSAAHKENLMWHKDAFTMAFAPLPVLASCEGYTARLPSGVSVRVMTFGNGSTDTESTRIDVLMGMSKVRSLHACRVAQ